MRGEFGIPKHLQNRKQKHNQATTTPTQNTNTKKQGHGKCLEGETRGEKRVKRPKRPNALICRTPGGSIRYLLSCSLGMTLISHSIVSIPASPSRFDIFFFLVSRTRHHSCAGHCSTIRSHCNFIRNATIPPGRNTQQKNTKPTATKQKTNNATPTTPKPKTKHLSGNRVAYFCTTYN